MTGGVLTKGQMMNVGDPVCQGWQPKPVSIRQRNEAGMHRKSDMLILVMMDETTQLIRSEGALLQRNLK